VEFILLKNDCVSGRRKKETLMGLKNIHDIKIDITKALKITVSFTCVCFII